MVNRIKVWDPFVRLFHWSLVILFAANALLTDPEKPLHQWIGYAIAALVVLRIVWGFVGTRHARFSDFLPSPAGVFRQVSDMLQARQHAHAGHSPLGALMIYNLLLTLAAICLTGYMMTTLAYFGEDWVEEAHEALVTWAEISVLLHVAAVLVESLRLRVNLIKSMVLGYKDIRP
jgi:cytochrome b